MNTTTEPRIRDKSGATELGAYHMIAGAIKDGLLHESTFFRLSGKGRGGAHNNARVTLVSSDLSTSLTVELPESEAIIRDMDRPQVRVRSPEDLLGHVRSLQNLQATLERLCRYRIVLNLGDR